MRFIHLIFLTLAALTVFAIISVFPQKPCFENGGSYTFYCGTSSADCKIVTVEQNAGAEKVRLKNICGESTEYEKFDMNEFLEAVNGKIVYTEELSDSTNYYCTADLPYSAVLYGEKINLHISVRNDKTRVASPIIFGGY